MNEDIAIIALPVMIVICFAVAYMYKAYCDTITNRDDNAHMEKMYELEHKYKSFEEAAEEEEEEEHISKY